MRNVGCQGLSSSAQVKECTRHSFLSLYLARDVSTGIFSNADSSSTPKEEQPQLQHRHRRKTSWRLAVYLHSLPAKAPTIRYFPGATSYTFRLEGMSRKLRKISVANMYVRTRLKVKVGRV
ncbi:hypothetical protein E2C01_034347 [Portunus trituberculatus]|uniref:Uncharacterized protein n=1 Tax=Portunus trituberculatus TaxID=210409 RepID=A0A5B7F6D9_PORTR|nr:hypothetical protein [Portunus trituberculatus]